MNEEELRELLLETRIVGTSKDGKLYLASMDISLLIPLIRQYVREQERERIFNFIRQVGQQIDEDGKGTDDPSKVVETIWYIGEGRLKDFEQALKQGGKYKPPEASPPARE